MREAEPQWGARLICIISGEPSSDHGNMALNGAGERSGCLGTSRGMWEAVPSISLDLSPLDVDDFTWEPPTEAETKVLQARRERQDRISRLMGDYLLRGYRMLGDTCADCGVRRVMRLRLRTRPQDLFSALSSVDPVSQAHLCPCTFWFPDDPPPR